MAKTKIESELTRENVEEKDLSTLDNSDFVLNKEKSEENLDEKARELQLLLQIIEEISEEGGKEMVVENMKEDEELLELADELGAKIIGGTYKLAESMNLKDICEAKEKLNRLLEKIRLFKEMASKRDANESQEESEVALDKVEPASKYTNNTKPTSRFKAFVTGALVTLFGASPIVGNADKSFGADAASPSTQASDAELIKGLRDIEAKRKAAEALKQTQNQESNTLPELEMNNSLQKEVPDWCRNLLNIKVSADGSYVAKIESLYYRLTLADLEKIKQIKEKKDEEKPDFKNIRRVFRNITSGAYDENTEKAVISEAMHIGERITDDDELAEAKKAFGNTPKYSAEERKKIVEHFRGKKVTGKAIDDYVRGLRGSGFSASSKPTEEKPVVPQENLEPPKENPLMKEVLVEIDEIEKLLEILSTRRTNLDIRPDYIKNLRDEATSYLFSPGRDNAKRMRERMDPFKKQLQNIERITNR